MKNLLLVAFVAMLFGGCATDFGAYKTGVEVPAVKMDQIVVNKSIKADVESIVGYPTKKEMLGSTEIWRYQFQKIRHIGANVNEDTIFEFDKKGVVIKKYKTGGTSANPLTGQ